MVHEPIRYAKNGQGYLRVTKFSLWWQQRGFPGVWTSEGLTTCVETEYKWSVNSTTWNDLQAMCQGSPLDLLRQVHEDTQQQVSSARRDSTPAACCAAGRGNACVMLPMVSLTLKIVFVSERTNKRHHHHRLCHGKARRSRR